MTRLLIHALGIAAATALAGLCSVLPFLPGRHDGLAAPIAAMARLFGFVGWLLVPVGLVWAAAESGVALAKWRRACAVVALVAASIVALAVAFAGLTFSGPALGIASLAVAGGLLRQMAARVRSPGNALPAYFVVVPAAALARDRVIRNAEPLIADIESFRATHGRYPESLLSVNQDYPIGVIGVKEYRYEPSGESFNLAFEPFTLVLDTREIVVFNPRDEQVMSSHDSDLLRFSAEVLARSRGYYAAEPLPQEHWKRFLFD